MRRDMIFSFVLSYSILKPWKILITAWPPLIHNDNPAIFTVYGNIPCFQVL